MPAPYYALPFPPEDQLISQMEALIREGLPPALAGTNWTGDLCPSGHWLMPQGAHLFRGDIPAEIKTPCIILFFMRDSEPLLVSHQDYWRITPAITVIWNRHLTTQETDQIRFCLLALFTQDLAAPVPTEQRSVLDRLSLDSTADTPGLRIFDIRNVQCALDRSTAGHPEFLLTFEAIAMSLQLSA